MTIFRSLRSFLLRFFPSLSGKGRGGTRALGQHGENFATNHLKRSGYRIIARNWRWKRWEIDIIASKENLLVFVEVKARSRVDFGRPEEAVDREKAAFVRKAATAFIKKNRLQQAVHRFDIIAVTLTDDNKSELRHIENAF